MASRDGAIASTLVVIWAVSSSISAVRRGRGRPGAGQGRPPGRRSDVAGPRWRRRRWSGQGNVLAGPSRVELVQVPAQPVHDPCAFTDKRFSMVGEKPHSTARAPSRAPAPVAAESCWTSPPAAVSRKRSNSTGKGRTMVELRLDRDRQDVPWAGLVHATPLERRRVRLLGRTCRRWGQSLGHEPSASPALG